MFEQVQLCFVKQVDFVRWSMTSKVLFLLLIVTLWLVTLSAAQPAAEVAGPPSLWTVRFFFFFSFFSVLFFCLVVYIATDVRFFSFSFFRNSTSASLSLHRPIKLFVLPALACRWAARLCVVSPRQLTTHRHVVARYGVWYSKWNVSHARRHCNGAQWRWRSSRCWRLRQRS